MMLRWILVPAGLAIAGCVSTSPAPNSRAAIDAELVAMGRDLAVTQCSSCHAIDNERISPRPEAPPMLSLLQRYEPDMLANDLIEGVRVGHDDMPHFDMTVIAADALIAYLKSIEQSVAAAERN